MIYFLLWILAVSSHISLLPLSTLQAKLDTNNRLYSQIPTIHTQLHEIEEMLQKEAGTLNPAVIHKVITALKCATEYSVQRNNILTVIDYSLPSNEKRLWVFDLNQKKLLYNTYVSHGIRSGALFTNFFSNKNNSKASSIGIYKTEKAYYGREGLSLRLDGLEQNFNDNASNRSVVMHGGWYVEEGFIKRYGRPGRSWGCPALPLALYQPIINTIKESSFMVVYYPSEEWFVKSKFLTCDVINAKTLSSSSPSEAQPATDTSDTRDAIIFAEVKSKKNVEGVVLAMSADNYEKIFKTQAPLSRMLRRQINSSEYIALSTHELNRIVAENKKEAMDALGFVIPDIIMVRGYYETQMKLLDLGQIKDIRVTATNPDSKVSYLVSFTEKPAINLRSSNNFVRWVGL